MLCLFPFKFVCIWNGLGKLNQTTIQKSPCAFEFRCCCCYLICLFFFSCGGISKELTRVDLIWFVSITRLQIERADSNQIFNVCVLQNGKFKQFLLLFKLEIVCFLSLKKAVTWGDCYTVFLCVFCLFLIKQTNDNKQLASVFVTPNETAFYIYKRNKQTIKMCEYRTLRATNIPNVFNMRKFQVFTQIMALFSSIC